MDRQTLIKALRDTAQSASNTVAGNVSGPVDLLAMGLRKIGLPIPSDPVGGSEWMARQGLTREVEDGIPKVAGETFGVLAPMMMVEKAPQIAAGINRMASNAMAPKTLNKQAGMIRIQKRGQIPETATDVKKLSDRFGKLLDQAGVEYATEKSALSPARYFMFDNPKNPDEMFKVRISDHKNVHGADFSVDPNTGATFEEMIKSLRDIGVPIADRVKPDLSIGKKVASKVQEALDLGPNSLIRAATTKYGPIGSEGFKSSPYKEAEQRLYKIASMPRDQYTKEHIKEIEELFNLFK